jgi:hypothetical protein
MKFKNKKMLTMHKLPQGNKMGVIINGESSKGF